MAKEFLKNALNNIERYYYDEASVCERVSANICEAAKITASRMARALRGKKFFSIEDFREELLAAPFAAASFPELVIEENRTLAQAKLSSDEGAYLAEFCSKLTGFLHTAAKFRPSPALFLDRSGDCSGNGCVSFVSGELFSGVFSLFSKKLPELKAMPAGSFSDACEAVGSGEAEYCILPLENNCEGTLLTFLSMIERYELLIARVAQLSSAEGTSTRYALLCQDFRGIIDSAGRQYVAVRLSGFDETLLPKLFAAIPVLGVQLIKTVSVPLLYTDGYAHICTFGGSESALFSLLLFLNLIRADYTLKGIYELID